MRLRLRRRGETEIDSPHGRVMGPLVVTTVAISSACRSGGPRPGGQDALIDRFALGGLFSECTWRVTLSASCR